MVIISTKVHLYLVLSSMPHWTILFLWVHRAMSMVTWTASFPLITFTKPMDTRLLRGRQRFPCRIKNISREIVEYVSLRRLQFDCDCGGSLWVALQPDVQGRI